MTEGLQRLWRSVGFRLAFYYGLLVAITMLAALAIVYLQTVGGVNGFDTSRKNTATDPQVADLSVVYGLGDGCAGSIGLRGK